MQYLKLSKEDLINIFVNNLLATNRSFNFYVNWDNINVYKSFNIELHALNVLIKCDDFDNTFKSLLKKIPTVVATFPYLFALSKSERENVWNGNEELLIANDNIGNQNNLKYDFNIKKLNKGLSDKQIDEYLFFFKKIGLKYLFLNLAENNIVDYVIGVLVGIDPNGRKNRGGKAFELICEPIIRNLCLKYKIELITQKQFKILRQAPYNLYISEDICERKADFILIKNKKYLNIEVNYYNGSGSKPEEIIDSYINRQRDLYVNNISFALITDGEKCWNNNTKSQLLKGFRNLRYLMNFNLSKNGMLEEIINEIFI